MITRLVLVMSVAYVSVVGIHVPALARESSDVNITSRPWVSCPTDADRYWIRLSVRVITCDRAVRISDRAWAKAPYLSLGDRWRGRVGRWRCVIVIGDQAGAQLTCRLGRKGIKRVEAG